MPKDRIVYVCTECKHQTNQWMGKCNECNSWNSLEETSLNESHSSQSQPKLIYKVSEVKDTDSEVIDLYHKSIESIYAGGVPYQSITLLAGEPGCGKSTLALDIIKNVKEEILYITGEESVAQVAKRVKRLEISKGNLFLQNETNWKYIKKSIESKKYRLIIIDSVQTCRDENINGISGSTSQVRSIVLDLLDIIKDKNLAVILINQVTKDGSIAGPKMLEHMVDVSLYIKKFHNNEFCELSVQKNRYNGIKAGLNYKILDSGIQYLEAIDLQKIKLNSQKTLGAAYGAYFSNNNYYFTRVESLVRDSESSLVSIKSQNISITKIQTLIAIIEKQFQISFSKKEVFIRTEKRAYEDDNLDLSIIISLLSSFLKKKVPNNYIFLGRVNLLGEVEEQRELEVIKKILSNISIERVFTNVDEGISEVKVAKTMEIDELFQLFKAPQKNGTTKILI